MPTFVLDHHHTADECRSAFAAWRGFASPLRRRATLGSCGTGGHRLLWTVEAPDGTAALAQLPPYVAERTSATLVAPTPIP